MCVLFMLREYLVGRIVGRMLKSVRCRILEINYILKFGEIFQVLVNVSVEKLSRLERGNYSKRECFHLHGAMRKSQRSCSGSINKIGLHGRLVMKHFPWSDSKPRRYFCRYSTTTYANRVITASSRSLS